LSITAAPDDPAAALADYPLTSGGGALGARLRRLSERIDRDAGRLYAQAGIPFEQRWYGVLNQLVLRGPLSVGELAQLLGITQASVSQTRQSLAAAGLIGWETDPADGRRRTLHLTPQGQALVARLVPLWAMLIATAAELDAEAGHVTAALDRLDQALDRRSLYERALTRMGETPA
jgi:DNA-binding MarR family transcriptional regulator